MFDETTIRFLHGGCAVLVGTVDEHGRPHGDRGWGLTLVTSDPPVVRVLVNAADERTVANARVGAPIAICTADVPTLHSMQLKGRVTRVEAATEDDLLKQEQYTQAFTTDIHLTDGEPLDLLRRWAECPVVACVVEIDETFDQTPGPSAGARLDGAPR